MSRSLSASRPWPHYLTAGGWPALCTTRYVCIVHVHVRTCTNVHVHCTHIYSKVDYCTVVYGNGTGIFFGAYCMMIAYSCLSVHRTSRHTFPFRFCFVVRNGAFRLRTTKTEREVFFGAFCTIVHVSKHLRMMYVYMYMYKDSIIIGLFVCFLRSLCLYTSSAPATRRRCGRLSCSRVM